MPSHARRRALAAFLACALIFPAAGRAAQSAPARASGTLIVEFQDDISHLDTALCYDNTCYPFAKAMFDRLVDYKGATNNLIPDAAAAMPVISHGGKTYTFKLRNNVRFWNGRLATSADWIYSFERIINPKTQSGGQSFWLNIVGANDFANGKTAHVSGLKALGQFGLQINLVDPDSSFLNVLAMPFGSVVDKNQITKYGKSYDALHPMGTGPYMFTQHTPGQKLILTRNPHYFLPNVGKVQTIQADIGVSTETALLRIEKGQADLDGDFPTTIPSADFLNVLNDPVLGKRLYQAQQIATEYIFFNVNMAPFNNLLVRRAINMAINRTTLSRLVNGRGVPTTTIEPPLMPGYGKFDLYPYNIQAAKGLLAKAGFPNGFSTTFYTDNTTDDARLSQSIVQQLGQIGVKASLRVLDANTFQTLFGTKNKVPIGLNGWYEDFPDPNDFIEPILSCASAVTGSQNASWFCDPKVDAVAQRLKGMTDQKARLAQYPALDRMIMEEAPWVPLLTPVFYVLPSTHVKDFYFNLVWFYVYQDYAKV
ncbi:MAG TPA: ABC transporter substrate-binding protein [Chloroflexota bacterium]|nr:ABC transporter substrate-binding protein [Chloroflexota bacterium]